jgi:hypothetical protein
MNNAALYIFCLLGSVWLSAQAYLPKYRNATRWIRSAIGFSGFLCAAWSGLGLFLIANGQNLGSRSFWALDHTKSMLCGVLVGILLMVMTSPEYRQIRHASRS